MREINFEHYLQDILLCGKVPEHNNGGELSVFVAAEHKPMRKKS